MNRTARQSLNWRTPYEALYGQTPDVSIMLTFVFWELCYIRNYQAGSKNFPSESNEIPVRVVGFSESVGHSITYKVYNEATGALLYRSHLRKIDHGADINSRVSPSQFLIAAPVFSVRRPSRHLFSDSSPIVCQPQKSADC